METHDGDDGDGDGGGECDIARTAADAADAADAARAARAPGGGRCVGVREYEPTLRGGCVRGDARERARGVTRDDGTRRGVEHEWTDDDDDGDDDDDDDDGDDARKGVRRWDIVAVRDGGEFVRGV